MEKDAPSGSSVFGDPTNRPISNGHPGVFQPLPADPTIRYQLGVPSSGTQNHIYCYPPPRSYQDYNPTAPNYSPGPSAAAAMASPFGGFGGFGSTNYAAVAESFRAMENTLNQTVKDVSAIKDLEDRVGLALHRLSLLERRVDKHNEEIGNLDTSMAQMIMNDDDSDDEESKSIRRLSDAETASGTDTEGKDTVKVSEE